MDVAQHLALIDRLCALEFSPTEVWARCGESGPGHHTAVLRTSGDFWEDDGTGWEETAAQYEADRDGLVERLSDRWGPSQHFSLRSVLDRVMEDEEIAEPWAGLSEHVPDVHLWRAPSSGRWVVLGVSYGYKELPFQLLGVVTETDPP
ncbi:hypothetical protein [Streptomyces sp. NPDC005573]|uniref:hypothetical protein n=1 Tax=unclassified Streptomyces TaxID=2593676 RepID=UPI0033B7F11B